MKFFVYANKSDVKNTNVQDGRAIYFVPEPKMREWVSKFDPSIMEFCGVSLEADDREEAKRIFLQPLENDGLNKIFVEQEPLLTRHSRRRHQETQDSVSKATMELMTQRLATLWDQIDEVMRAIAQISVMNHNELTEDQAYARLKNAWIDRYRGME